MWLGDLFSELDCRALPALSCRQALALAAESDCPISSLFVNPEMRGARRMVKMLTLANPRLRVILIHGPAVYTGNGNGHSFHVSSRASLERPGPWESISRQEWVSKLRRALFERDPAARV